MRTHGPRALLAPLIVVALFALASTARGQAIEGRVIDATTGEPLSGASVQVIASGGAEVAGGSAGQDGDFRFQVQPGTYSIVVTRIGHETRRMDGLSAGAGPVTVALVERAVAMNPMVVTASRSEESQLDAPATVAVVEREEIREQSAPTVAEHVKGQVGVDIAQTGIQQSNVVTRGFNNVFSGALLVIQDYRYARVPSLRLNAYNLIPTTNLDLDHVEIVLGPGAALYGPNSASGVMHMISTSPIDDPGTTVSLAGGERSIFHGIARHASQIGENAGIRVSAQYFRGNDFDFVDLEEEDAREIALMTDPNTLVGLRNHDAGRFSFDGRVDVRPWEDGEIVFSGGLNRLIDSIELTGLGAAQGKDWTYSYGQVRARKGKLFAQTFINMSNAGDSYLLRTGQPITDESFFWAGQVQHGFEIEDHTEILYGLDVQRTEPRTEGTITGRNEDDDTINEIGGYVHTETRLSDAVKALAALRVDHHNRVEDVVLSPRAGVVIQPAPQQNFRLMYNRAFSTPTTNNLFLDIVAGQIPIAQGIGYDIRTRGTPETGFTFSRECPGGFDGGFCMYSPFVPGQRLPANAALAWNTLLGVLAPPDLQPFLGLIQSDAPPVETILRRFDPEGRTFVLDTEGPTDIGRIQPTITETFEAGYKGLLGDRVLIAADVYRSDIDDFVTPLRVETSTVFLDPTTTAAFLTERLTPLVLNGTLTPQQLQGIVTQLTTGLAQVPIGTIAPDQSDTSDILLAYRNFGSIALWGADFAAEILLTDVLSLKGTYSWVSEECFDFDDNGTCEDLLDVALNAPQNKGSIGLRYRDVSRGLTAEAQARFVSEFVMNSGVYVGVVEGYGVLDANVEYQLPWFYGAALGLTAYNVLDNEHREFIGAPDLGRIVMGRIKWDLP